MEKKMWCIPDINDSFIERMDDVLDLYARPYNEEEPVVCIDEKTLQFLDHLRSPRPITTEHCERVDYQYKRNGVANIFVCVEPLGGRRYLKVSSKKARVDFLECLHELHLKYPNAKHIHLVLDNLGTHSEKHVRDVEWLYSFLKRFEFHFTPVHASWLDMAELEIGVLERQSLKEMRFPDIEILESHVKAWEKDRNEKDIKLTWRFTKEKARRVFKMP
nr:IS630 family transposase [Candidatus Sigynarchaeota archaeon]